MIEEIDDAKNCFLGIPVPKSVMSMRKLPPVFPNSIGDLRAAELIEDFGREFGCSSAEITQALNLASGPSDVIVVLERPLKPRSHDYAAPFEQFVSSCETLSAVDELIRFATKGTRSIHSVTVIDAYMFKPDERPSIPDERCHQLLGQIIRLKTPKVVVCCHTSVYKDSWMKRFELRHTHYGVITEYLLTIKPVAIDNETNTYAVQSFHPSRAVNYMQLNPEYRALLLHHFIAAFSCLYRQYSEPDIVEKIRTQCVLHRKDN